MTAAGRFPMTVGALKPTSHPIARMDVLIAEESGWAGISKATACGLLLGVAGSRRVEAGDAEYHRSDQNGQNAPFFLAISCRYEVAARFITTRLA